MEISAKYEKCLHTTGNMAEPAGRAVHMAGIAPASGYVSKDD